MWRRIFSAGALLKTAAIAAVISISISAGALVYDSTHAFDPVRNVTLGIPEGTSVAPGEGIPIHLTGCTEAGNNEPLVVLTLFVSKTAPEALLGAGAVAVLDPAKAGCKDIDAKLFIPARATPGKWRAVLLTFAQGKTQAQTVIVTSPEFTVHGE